MNRKFSINADVKGVECPNLLQLPNPNHEKVTKASKYLTGMTIEDIDKEKHCQISIRLSKQQHTRVGEL